MLRTPFVSAGLLALVLSACELPPAPPARPETGRLDRAAVDCGSSQNCGYCSNQADCSTIDTGGNVCCACDEVFACGSNCLHCSTVHATPTCTGNAEPAAQSCSLDCDDGWANTDDDVMNGCETQCNSIDLCGSDCLACGTDHASPSCSGHSEPAAIACVRGCNEGFDDADGDPTNGCEAECNTQALCGSDCQPCHTNAYTSSNDCTGNGTAAVVACNPTCTSPVGAGVANWNNNNADGCELCDNIAACGTDCLVCAAQHASASCSGATAPAATACQLDCDDGWTNANGLPTDGCEAQCNTVTYCGTDCLPCGSQHAAPTCSGNAAPAASACQLNCNLGWDDADGNPTNGCETPCNSTARCGSDCLVCGNQHASPTCSGNGQPAATSCVRNCELGWTDANGDPTDGCETPCNTIARCGTDCLACGSQHASPACANNTLPAAQACQLNCAPGWADADGNPTNGCETPCNTIARCGSDCLVCGAQHTSAAPTCTGNTAPAASACQIICQPGWENHDTVPTNGCELQCNTAGHCGSDCVACGTAHADPTCLGNTLPGAQSCVLNCHPGWYDANGQVGDDCEAQCNTPTRCGTDCLACGSQHASPACANNTLPAAQACQLNCAPGWADADGNPTNGCETPCNTIARCGSDCLACGSQHTSATPTCSGSTLPAAQACGIVCAPGYLNDDGLPENGCETTCDTVEHCGTDCQVCGDQNASPSCLGNLAPAAAACERNCDPGWVDLDTNPTNGCEGECNTTSRCGLDCLPCGSQHTATLPTCSNNDDPAATACVLPCAAGWRNVDNNPTNGCETACDSIARCGSDCLACGTFHASPTCSNNTAPAAQACQLNCAPGWLDITGGPTDGCETACTDTTRCGTDCLPCGDQHASPTCTGNTAPAVEACLPNCDSGWANANNIPTDGCEAQCNTAARCGRDCLVCGNQHTSVPPACLDNVQPAAAACVITCLTGFENADGDPTNGCETGCQSIAECGADCRPCGTQHASPVCLGNNGTAAQECQLNCHASWANDDGNPSNGCETECTRADLCGSDCRACSADHATTSCLGSVLPAVDSCHVTCEAGWRNVDNDPTNGCEAPCNLPTRCGLECERCGTLNTSSVDCDGNTTAMAVACRPICRAGYEDLDGDRSNGCESACDEITRCGHTCAPCPPLPHMVPTCRGADFDPATACSYECEPGWADNDPYQDGCETECNTVERCGSDCMPCQVGLFAATSVCQGNAEPWSQSCGVSCDTGYLDANEDWHDGCEACAPGYYDAADPNPPPSCQVCDVDRHCGAGCIDCSGSPDGNRCTFGRCGCNSGEDCPGTTCRNHICVIPCDSEDDCPYPQRCCPSTGDRACVVHGEEVCDGKDNDCNDLVDDNLDSADAPLCENQQGVCKGSRWSCVEGLFRSCDQTTYAAYSSAYQTVETRCDGLDNDCNGETDELEQCRLDAGLPDAASGVTGRVYDLGGCGCAQASTAAAAVLLGLLALPGLARRRRREPGPDA